jgi:hypothetical protein
VTDTEILDELQKAVSRLAMKQDAQFGSVWMTLSPASNLRQVLEKAIKDDYGRRVAKELAPHSG